MHRPTIGIIAIVLVIVGLATRSPTDNTVSSACLRIAAIMAILWFAEPQMRNVPRWAWIVGGVGVFLILRWPPLIALAIPLGVVVWLLRPRLAR